ncbi:MAG: hypothetical protein AAFO75_04370 [Pseudomonadota bacterium]
MRYLVAMAFAAGGALAMSFFISNTAASWMTRQFVFENPDQVSDLHSITFMALNLLGLVIGWSIGFGIGKAIDNPEAGDPEK